MFGLEEAETNFLSSSASTSPVNSTLPSSKLYDIEKLFHIFPQDISLEGIG